MHIVVTRQCLGYLWVVMWFLYTVPNFLVPPLREGYEEINPTSVREAVYCIDKVNAIHPTLFTYRLARRLPAFGLDGSTPLRHFSCV